MPKIKAKLEPAEKIDYKCPHLDNLNKKYPGNNNEDTEMPDVKQITPINYLSIN